MPPEQWYHQGGSLAAAMYEHAQSTRTLDQAINLGARYLQWSQISTKFFEALANERRQEALSQGGTPPPPAAEGARASQEALEPTKGGIPVIEWVQAMVPRERRLKGLPTPSGGDLCCVF